MMLRVQRTEARRRQVGTGRRHRSVWPFLLVALLVGRLRTVTARLHRERRQLLQTQDVTISALAYQSELRDFATGQHLERTARYVELVAIELAKLPRYRRTRVLRAALTAHPMFHLRNFLGLRRRLRAGGNREAAP